MFYSMKKILKESIPILSLLMIIQIFGGQILNIHLEKFLMLPILLMFIPMVNGVCGNIGSILGARVSSGLHVGYITPDFRGKELRENVIGVLFLSFLTFVFLGCLVYVISSSFKLVVIMIGAGMLVTFGVICLCIPTAIISFRKGIDPDNVVIPILTTGADVLGILCLLLMIKLVGI
ncbi:MAG: magnesium transporter [Candidatus Thermoplasmatota archaeon]|nr:magnesium transporter [Candidatus Thermoplasmatota archaeon]